MTYLRNARKIVASPRGRGLMLHDLVLGVCEVRSRHGILRFRLVHDVRVVTDRITLGRSRATPAGSHPHLWSEDDAAEPGRSSPFMMKRISSMPSS